MNFLNKKYSIIFFTVLMLDFISKMLALAFLPYNEMVFSIGENQFYLYLTYNEGSSSFMLNNVSNELGIPNKNLYLILGSITNGLMGLYIYFSKFLKIKNLWKVIIGVVAFFLLVFINDSIENYYKDLIINDYFTSWFSKIGSLLFLFIIFLSFKNKTIKLLLIILFASGVGNFINHFYPPFHVIDFIYIDFLNRYFGIGIFNIADLMINLFYILLLGYIVKLIVLFIKMKLRKEKNKTLTGQE